MSDNATPNPTRIDGGNTPSTITLTITFDPSTGNVSVTGPVANPILFLGMLKLAEKTHDALRLRGQLEQAKQSTPRIHTL